MSSRQPRTTLFPYTTLFRSVQSPKSGEGRDSLKSKVQSLKSGEEEGRGEREAVADMPDSTLDTFRKVTTFLERFARWRRLADRKSTRLNSSHQIISYAVFCL